MIKLGIIGTSWITAMFLDAAVQTKAYELTTVYSRSQEKGQKFLSSLAFNTENVDVVTTLSDLYQNVDAVYIASPNALHFEQAKVAIQSGVHAIVEKPLFSNPAEFKQIENLLATHPDVLLFEAARHVHQPNFKLIQSIVKKMPKLQGATLVYQKYSSRYDAYLAGEEPNVLTKKYSAGALYDLGVYPIYAALAIYGAPNAVQYLPTLLRNGVDGNGVANLFYSGFNVTVIFGKTSNSYLSSEFYGLKDTISVSNIAELESVIYHDSAGQVNSVGAKPENNPMVREAQDFANIINDPIENHAEYNQWLQLAKQVNQTLFDLRQSAEIEFPADIKE
ncbi:oxidoreductase [Leuconostoc litchii]|uniref:Gfo/Idh/MocA family oxidoreductase n=1 Tax=Leuconostoc litchii TaxID=1981069 RepID=A0A6P2CT03_9LACO|nr:Gfo/Idh/MocA family oxidoreductase [Leuconostoc litchii]TYC47397.1 Gfo/Idh/MocA family oxidoreductase [Leuconostoc litchii]GMA69411.1 oxidoreductase [Leuconostoc litchii]